MSEDVQALSRRYLENISTIADQNIDLATAALHLSALHQPIVSLDAYHRHLRSLVRDVKNYLSPNDELNADHAMEAMSEVMVKRYGYGGFDPVLDDLDSASLTTVIDNRCGLPVALGLLFLHVGRSLGWDMHGLDFPGRFLVRLDMANERRVFDPFGDAYTLEAHELRALLKVAAGNEAELSPNYLKPQSNRGILLRLENNRKIRQLHAGNVSQALHTIETMLLFAPEIASLWREAGMIHAKLDQNRRAIMAFEEYLNHETQTPNRYNATVMLQELHGRLS